ncbi:Hypothetical predicted protein [Pelobates cultripes]|uniref:Uncharacterized protein n=1 Tax=Pelobates cultripes TaxID=61616 RepID=A0AAD1VX66_PELCU|nr:Hypothetical predicted protein [Pelobates cultripes]
MYEFVLTVYRHTGVTPLVFERGLRGGSDRKKETLWKGETEDQDSPDPQRDAVGGSAERGLDPPGFTGSLESWTWRSPLHPTNSSSIDSGHRSGLVPGLIAAAIFIVFLLCLYTILWRCMVSQSKRHRKRLQRAKNSKRTLPHKPVCAV